MKKIVIFSFIVLAGFNQLFAQDKKEGPKAEIAFEKIIHDFGNIWYGAP